MKKIRREHKGFTLVELIVVLVILAILAAILVPALLGWIDEARKKQDIVNAKALMTAIQAQMTEEYGKGAKSFSGFADDNKKHYDDIYMVNHPDFNDFMDDACKLTGVEKPFVFLFYTKKISDDDIKKRGTEALHEAYTILSAVYWRDKDSKPVFYDFIDNIWAEGSPYSADLIKRGENKIQKGPLSGKQTRVCIVGGTSKYATVAYNTDADKYTSAKVKAITAINNMILKVMDYKKSGINWKNEISSVKIE